MVSEITIPTENRSLSRVIRDALEEKRMNNSELARQAGVSEATIRNLLKQGSGEEPAKPHPLVLRQIAEVLELDQVQMFLLAGYIAPGYEPHILSARAQYVGLCFDILPPEQQNFLSGMLQSMMDAVGLHLENERTQQLLQEIEVLREQHPMFRERRFGLTEDAGRRGGNWSRTTTRGLMLKMLQRRLRAILGNDHVPAISEAYIEEVTNHPDIRIVLNTLLPRKVIPTALEKLFWLCFPWGTMDKLEKKLSTEHWTGIEALWQLLERLAQVTG